MNTYKRLSSLILGYRVYTFIWCSVLLTLPLKGYSQCVVYKDRDQQLVTTCEFYNTSGKSATAAFRRETYLGSPFLTYPVWQEGRVQVKAQDNIVRCEIAYNVVSSEVMCRFNGDSTVVLMTPEKFVIDSVEYTRQANKQYTTVLYTGQTKLLMSQSRQIEANHNYSFTKNKDIIGVYQTTTKYYLQKGNTTPEPIFLSRKSVLAHLSARKEQIKDKLPTSPLTLTDLIDVLTYYDSLETGKPSPGPDSRE